jgi:hypothetical protein
LWNRYFAIKPKQINNYNRYLAPSATFAAQAAMLHLLLMIMSPDSKWTTKLYELIENNDSIDSSSMGFDLNWHNDGFWGVNS